MYSAISGVLAMETLHKQVLPFVLRRLKEDVLDDLPPKIIQDYYCDLSPLQVCLECCVHVCVLYPVMLFCLRWNSTKIFRDRRLKKKLTMF